MALHPPLLGRGISSWGVEGCDHCQFLWLRKGEGKDTAMASARLLGVILLPGEARSEEHGLHPSLLGRGVSSRAVEERRPCRFISHLEGRGEGCQCEGG